MRIVIAGGHGKIAMLLARSLAERGDSSVGIVRNPDHTADLKQLGAGAVVLDLERATVDEVADVLRDADAVVFAAGAGPGSGAARKDTVDRGAAVLLATAAERVGVRRFIQISTMGLDRAEDPSVEEVFRIYLQAKGAAEQDLLARKLDWTILRPGRLTDDPQSGRVRLAPSVPRGSVSRADVAAVVLDLLDDPATVGQTLELVSA